jgi:ABC-type antimicrobial peptide transport system permease subunit
MRASALNYLSWAERSKSFDAIAAFGNAGLTLTGDGDPDLLNGSVVTPSLFDVLAVSPIVGRTLRPDDEQRGSSRVVVDPMTFAAIGGAVMLVACAASAFPAVRAAHIDPTIAMRTE